MIFPGVSLRPFIPAPIKFIFVQFTKGALKVNRPPDSSLPKDSSTQRE